MIISTENNFSLTIAVGSSEDTDCVSKMKVDQSLNELVFESSGHLSSILAGLNVLRSRGQLTDVALKTENETFRAHRVVLAACSDYFRAMFTDPMREREQTDIFLAGVSSLGMKLLLEYIYTSKLSLSLANIQDVLSAASHLQVLQVVEACSNYLQAQLDVDNCVDIVTIAETYSLHDLRTKVYSYISENLSAFSEKTGLAEFHRLTATQVEHLLESDFPVNLPEDRVLEMLLDWLNMESSSRMAHAHKLLKKVNFEEIHPAHLSSIVEKKVASSLPKSFLSRIQNLSDNSSGNDLHSTTYLVNSRGMEEAVIKIGGFGPQGVTNQVSYYLPSLKQWRQLTSIPHVECCNFGAAVVRNELFVIGGCFNQSLQEHIHPFGFKFNPRLNKWTTMAPMLKERCRFTLSVVGKSIYVFGGCAEQSEGDLDDESESTPICLCERYDVDSDTWTPIATLPNDMSLSQHASVRLGGKIFISGGLDFDHVVSDMLMVYDVEADCFETRIRRMPRPRADHVMLVWRERILICGGWYEDEANGLQRVLADSIDVYDPETDAWAVETRIPTPRYHAGISIVNHKLYIIGGMHNDNHFDRATRLMESFDLEAKTWSSEEAYPQELWEHICVSMHIPRSRNDIDILSLNKQ